MIIVRPLPIVNVSGGGTGSGLDNLKNPEPKEVWVRTLPGFPTVDVDLGSAQDVDSFGMLFTNAAAGAVWFVQRIDAMGGSAVSTPVPNSAFPYPESLGPPHHAFAKAAATVNGQFFRFGFSQPAGAAGNQIGVLVIGKAFQMPYEFGGGRVPIDTGTREPRPDGGFGIGDGVVKAGLRWTFVDLSPVQRRQLWALALSRGETSPILVDEELGEGAEGRNEEIHYGLFGKFESYDREAPSQTRWALSMEEWV